MNNDMDRLVRELARGLWTSDGGPKGKDLEHWLIAEQMVGELEAQTAKAGISGRR